MYVQQERDTKTCLALFCVSLANKGKHMGDDVSIIVPDIKPEEDDTYERAGEELVALLTAQAERLGECLARIAELENRIAVCEGREWAEVGHEHVGFATAEHRHDGDYAPIEHQHETETPPPAREPDHPPEKQHPYFRKLSDF